MSRDRQVLEDNYEKIAEQLAAYLKDGLNVAMPEYRGYFHLFHFSYVARKAAQARLPGESMRRGSLLLRHCGENRKTSGFRHPAVNGNPGRMRGFGKLSPLQGTKVLMKAAVSWERYGRHLHENGLVKGRPDCQRLWTAGESASYRPLPQRRRKKSNYFTTIIIRPEPN